jgi:hypothetical protein
MFEPNNSSNLNTKEGKANSANNEGTGKSFNKKPFITVETEAEILDKIQKHCNSWDQISTAYNVCIIIFGISAVSTSVLVSIYTGQAELISVGAVKVLACISTISLSILTAFNLVSNGTNARTAWRSLNAAMMMYKAGSISIQQLIEQYQKGESQVGNLSFNYGTNSDKPATYSNDIQGKDDVRDEKDHNSTSKEALTTSKVTNQQRAASGQEHNGLTGNQGNLGSENSKTEERRVNDQNTRHGMDNGDNANIEYSAGSKNDQVNPDEFKNASTIDNQ